MKNVYLAVIADNLNSCDAFLNKVKHSTSNVWGKEIRIMTHEESDGYVHLISDLATVKADIEISDKAIRASQNSVGAFVNLLNEEIENMINETKIKIDKMVYGKKPMFGFNNLDAIFEGDSIYGRDRDIDKLKANVKTVNLYDFKAISRLLDEYEIDTIVCSYDFQRTYREWLLEHKQNINFCELGNGFKGVLFDGTVPMITNRTIEKNCVYLLNSKDFELSQLCDWLWLEDSEGRVLKQHPTKPVYTATLIKYCNLMCKDFTNQVKVVMRGKNGAKV